MTADGTVAEVEAAGGIAAGIEVDVRDHEASRQWRRASSRSVVGSMSWSRMQAAVAVGQWIQRQHP
jgi:hypothetical protein